MNPYAEQNAINAMLKEKSKPVQRMSVSITGSGRFRQGVAGGLSVNLDTIGRESSCACGGTGKNLCEHLRAAMLAHLQSE